MGFCMAWQMIHPSCFMLISTIFTLADASVNFYIGISGVQVDSSSRGHWSGPSLAQQKPANLTNQNVRTNEAKYSSNEMIAQAQMQCLRRALHEIFMMDNLERKVNSKVLSRDFQTGTD
jgi:hypothetical protein